LCKVVDRSERVKKSKEIWFRLGGSLALPILKLVLVLDQSLNFGFARGVSFQLAFPRGNVSASRMRTPLA